MEVLQGAEEIAEDLNLDAVGGGSPCARGGVKEG